MVPLEAHPSRLDSAIGSFQWGDAQRSQRSLSAGNCNSPRDNAQRRITQYGSNGQVSNCFRLLIEKLFRVASSESVFKPISFNRQST